jgi:cell division initiation protein
MHAEVNNAMDRILPIDLERAQLRKSFRGYARKEVDMLLAGAAASMQQALVDNDRMRQEIEQLRAEVERTRLTENTLRDTLVLAQQAADDARNAAQKQAEAMIEQGRQSAITERSLAQQHLSELRWEIEKLKIEKNRFTDEFRSMLGRYERDLPAPTLVIVEGEAAEA